MPVIDRWLVSVPMVHLVTLGAGGGSIARYRPPLQVDRSRPEIRRVGPGPGLLRPRRDAADGDRRRPAARLPRPGAITPTAASRSMLKRASWRSRSTSRDHLDMERRRGREAHQAPRSTRNMANGIAKELRRAAIEPRGLHDPRVRRQRAAALLRHRQRTWVSNRVLAPPFASVFSALGAGNSTAAAHPRAHRTWSCCSTRPAASMFADFESFNGIVDELERAGATDLLRQGLPAEAVQLPARTRHALRQPARADRRASPIASRIAQRRDVLAMIDLFSQTTATRFGDGSQSPEAGIRIITIRVRSYVRAETRSQFDAALQRRGYSRRRAGVASARCHFVGRRSGRDRRSTTRPRCSPAPSSTGPPIVTTPPPRSWSSRAGTSTGAHGRVWFFNDIGRQQ